MPELVTATQLRNVLGVSVSLYADAALDEYIEAAEDAIGDFLVQHSCSIKEHKCVDNIWTNYTDRPHQFYEGQSIKIIENHHEQILLTKTVTEVIDDYTFTFTQVHPDFQKHAVIPNDKVYATGNGLDFYNGNPAIEKAVIALAVEIFQAILTTGGTGQALDFTPSPYRLGRTLLYKVTGLISKYMDERGMVG
jgi:hypothetical protein